MCLWYILCSLHVVCLWESKIGPLPPPKVFCRRSESTLGKQWLNVWTHTTCVPDESTQDTGIEETGCYGRGTTRSCYGDRPMRTPKQTPETKTATTTHPDKSRTMNRGETHRKPPIKPCLDRWQTLLTTGNVNICPTTGMRSDSSPLNHLVYSTWWFITYIRWFKWLESSPDNRLWSD